MRLAVYWLGLGLGLGSPAAACPSSYLPILTPTHTTPTPRPQPTQALETTWVRVNKDFGSIFSMLLPGTHAKLEPPEGATVAEGLEVKVSFNGVWKESLTELSGGQRSLLALSLILALLLFKPAPMYILDEVDAALDLSHTQNIGMSFHVNFSMPVNGRIYRNDKS